MRKLFTLLLAVLLTASVFAQAPEKISYQAVIRNNDRTLVTSTKIGMEINIRQGSPTGTVVYTETQTPTTNANGLVSIEIGGRAGFNTIKWGANTYFIETKTAVVAPLTTYTIIGVSQLLSVPYALNAKTAESITGTITETDPIYTGSQAANITAADIKKLSNLSGTNSGDQDLSGLATTSAVTTSLSLKVDKQVGKGLSTNDYTTAEQKKLAGIATGAQVNVKPDWNAVSGNDAEILNKPTIPTTADGSETKLTSGYGIVLSGAGTTASPYNISTPLPAILIPLAIGDRHKGGIIFWLDETNEHGLIAATEDQNNGNGISWGNGINRYTGTTGDGLYAGEMNTTLIVATQMADNQTGNFAAKVCADYSVTENGVTYGDWYLPSLYELKLLYAQKAAVGGFATIADYWSSTEYNSTNAFAFNFSGGYVGYLKTRTLRVRAVRAF